jgi:alpha-amylase/alpha-mannosidase (GH57 family)
MSTSEPIEVAFVWHMHQPWYRSALTGAFVMPWARLHALKDYLDMVEILSEYPTIRQTFNLVPS